MLKNRRLKSWAYVFGFVTLIYSTLYIVRPVCEYLKQATPFALLVNILGSILLMVVLAVFWSKARIKKFLSWLLLCFIIAAYTYGLAMMQYAEEKIHFVEYGFLAYLLLNAVHLYLRGPVAYIYAFLLGSALGWVDEGIQHILPNRYYQTEDVILNSVSVALGLLLVYVFNRERVNTG